MRFFKLHTSPTLRLLDMLAVRYLERRGNAVLSVQQAVGARTVADRLSHYVDTSGHLCTVKGRKPHAVKRLRRSLDALVGVLRPGVTYHNPDGSRTTRVTL